VSLRSVPAGPPLEPYRRVFLELADGSFIRVREATPMDFESALTLKRSEISDLQIQLMEIEELAADQWCL